jgi:hypothetical protein
LPIRNNLASFIDGHYPDRYRMSIPLANAPICAQSLIDAPKEVVSLSDIPKERNMGQVITEPILTKNGVEFTIITPDFVKCECIISTDALAALSPMRSESMGPMEIFHAYEAKILGVARRMLAANVKGSPLRLEPHSFH